MRPSDTYPPPPPPPPKKKKKKERNLGQHWFRLWDVAWQATSRYLNNDGILLIWPLETNLGEIIIDICTHISIQANAFENVVWEMAILSWHHCVTGPTLPPNIPHPERYVFYSYLTFKKIDLKNFIDWRFGFLLLWLGTNQLQIQDYFTARGLSHKCTNASDQIRSMWNDKDGTRIARISIYPFHGLMYIFGKWVIMRYQ